MRSKTKLTGRATAQVAVGFLWAVIAASTLAGFGSNGDGEHLVLQGTPPAAVLAEVEIVRSSDAAGNLYSCQYSPDTETHSVHRISIDGSSERLPGREEIVHPNGLALDQHLNLYVSDSEIGTLWNPGRWFCRALAPACLTRGHGRDSGLPPARRKWRRLLE